MNGVAHYLTGLLLTLLILKWYQKRNESFQFNLKVIVVIFFITFLSHILVDAFALFTYHPSNSDWGDPIYAGWHLLTYIGEFVFAIYFLKTDIRYSVGMIGAIGFDLWDWSFRRGLELEFLPELHWMADGARDILLSWWAPDLTLVQWALIVEILFVVITFYWWHKWHKTSVFDIQPRQSNWKEITVLILVFGILRLLTLV